MCSALRPCIIDARLSFNRHELNLYVEDVTGISRLDNKIILIVLQNHKNNVVANVRNLLNPTPWPACPRVARERVLSSIFQLSQIHRIFSEQAG